MMCKLWRELQLFKRITNYKKENSLFTVLLLIDYAIIWPWTVAERLILCRLIFVNFRPRNFQIRTVKSRLKLHGNSKNINDVFSCKSLKRWSLKQFEHLRYVWIIIELHCKRSRKVVLKNQAFEIFWRIW